MWSFSDFWDPALCELDKRETKWSIANKKNGSTITRPLKRHFLLESPKLEELWLILPVSNLGKI